MTTATTLAAYYYPASAGHPAALDFVAIGPRGQTRPVETITDANMTKREARGLAELRGAKPWNF